MTTKTSIKIPIITELNEFKEWGMENPDIVKTFGEKKLTKTGQKILRLILAKAPTERYYAEMGYRNSSQISGAKLEKWKIVFRYYTEQIRPQLEREGSDLHRLGLSDRTRRALEWNRIYSIRRLLELAKDNLLNLCDRQGITLIEVEEIEAALKPFQVGEE